MRAAAAGSVSGSGSQLSSVLGSGGGDGAPGAAALAWTVAAVTRRELSGMGATAKAAAVTTTGQSTPLSDFVRTFIGNGTADQPDAGILVGNGFSYDATTCTGQTACNGGKGGILGDGGAGYNGGKRERRVVRHRWRRRCRSGRPIRWQRWSRWSVPR